MRRIGLALVVLSAATFLSAASSLRAQAADSPLPEDTARVIVKLKADSLLLRSHPLSAAAHLPARAQTLGKRLGMAISAGSALSERTQVVFARGVSSAELARRLAQEDDVEYAVADRRRRPLAAPNDPLFPDGLGNPGPAVGQWYLRAPAGEARSSLDAETAWSVTTGSSSVVVTVLDTGVRFDHPDLPPVASGGNLLPGYDMVSDVDTANDGDGRDADASDPGDWLTESEISQVGGPFYRCALVPQESSWHGMQVSGLIAALTDNGIGMASIGRSVRVLPVRVLGKCGGFDSDIIAGMRWAAGLPVPGVPANPYPARVINLSLGEDGPCDAAYRDAVTAVDAAGVVIVAAAGNSAGHPVSSPANCSGVVAVAALRHVGTKVGFSNLGPEIAISAPGGNCVNVEPGAACLYPILTTSNSGKAGPEAPIYTDSFNPTLGTSFAVPLVAGTAALMRSLNPAMAPLQVRGLLQASARPFPTTGGDNGDGTPVLPCTPPRYDLTGRPIDQFQCYCTTDTCGAGMLDAGAAVLAAGSGGQSALARVVEYYNAALDHYFVTWMPHEIEILDAGIRIRGWLRTGRSFMTYTAPQNGTSPVCRYYIPPGLGDSHFFGRGTAECNETAAKFPNFVLEDPAFMQMFLPTAGACPAGTTQVYRVFSSRADANHRYMTDRALRDEMVAKGWLAEGDGPDRLVMCAPR